MTEDTRDKELTQAYRDFAKESTPAGLDDKILRMAARATRSRYGIARAWVRPIAWAATIGLSLVIVLEVMQIMPPSAPEPAAMNELAPEPPSADEAPARVQQDVTGRDDAAAVTTGAPVDPGGDAGGELAAKREVPQAPANAGVSRSIARDDADAFAANDMRILEEAEAQARQRSGDPAIATFTAIATEAQAAHCDETARATAESWYECIEALRESGDTQFADSELAALLLAFPDFEVPVPGK